VRRVLFLLAILLGLGASAWAANVKLYLKDGTYQLIREYQVQKDRVRYYSTERGDWEEIPLELVDLDRTKKEAAEHEEAAKAEAKLQSEEDAAEREVREEVANIPQDVGVYFIRNKKIEPLKQAESKVVSDKKRSVLKILSPIPIVSGKATLEIDGEKSAFKVDTDRPEFYFRLANEEHFGLIRLTPKKAARIVENISIIPVSKEIVEEQKEIETFKKQIATGLFKIWPTKPLEPGEYALVEFTPAETADKPVNLQAWDFSFGGK
jgi:hypothetical protein